MKVTEEDIEKGLAELAQETGKNVAKLKAEYREKQKRDILIGMILEDKILDFLESKSKITEGTAEAAAAGEGGSETSDTATKEEGDKPKKKSSKKAEKATDDEKAK